MGIDGIIFRRWSLLAFLVVAAASTAPVQAEEGISFNRHVRPILAENCFACHGFDSTARQAGLRLDAFQYATEVRRGHAAIVPGDPDGSEMIRRIVHTDARRRMPPQDTGHRVSDRNAPKVDRRRGGVRGSLGFHQTRSARGAGGSIHAFSAEIRSPS